MQLIAGVSTCRSSFRPTVRTALLVAFVALLAAFGCSQRSGAQFAKSAVWDRYDVTIDLNQDGSYHVVERQVVDFQGGPFTSGFAEIPMGRIDAIQNVVVKEATPQGAVTYQESSLCCGDYDYVSAGEYGWGRS